MRPVVTQSNIGLHWAIHWGYLGVEELVFDNGAADSANFLDKYKISEYGTSMLVTDRFMIELAVYLLLVVLSVLGMGKMGKMFGALRILVSWAIGFNLLFSCML